jgi:hypothetical protein
MLVEILEIIGIVGPLSNVVEVGITLFAFGGIYTLAKSYFEKK